VTFVEDSAKNLKVGLDQSDSLSIRLRCQQRGPRGRIVASTNCRDCTGFGCCDSRLGICEDPHRFSHLAFECLNLSL
jgi:hypothetical protein